MLHFSVFTKIRRHENTFQGNPYLLQSGVER